MQNVDVVGKTLGQFYHQHQHFACGSFSNFKVGQGILVTVTSPHIVNVKQMQNTPQKQNKKTTP